MSLQRALIEGLYLSQNSPRECCEPREGTALPPLKIELAAVLLQIRLFFLTTLLGCSAPRQQSNSNECWVGAGKQSNFVIADNTSLSSVWVMQLFLRSLQGSGLLKQVKFYFCYLQLYFFAGSFIFLLLGFAFKGTFAGSKCSVLFWWYSCVTQL